ncbi:MAG: amidohydrolase family protein [Bradymonadia bacterium]
MGPAQIRIEGDRLADVTPLFRSAFEAFNEQSEDGVTVLDVGDKLITPTWVNSHTHLAMTAFRGIGGLAARTGNVVEALFYQLEKSLQPGDVRAFARLGAYDALCTGTGAVWDHYYFGDEVAEAMLDVGLTGVVAPTFQDKGGLGESTESKAWAALETINGERFASHGIFSALGPHATDTVTDPLWRRIARYATEHNLPIHTHFAQSMEEYARSRTRHGIEPAVRLHRLGILDAGPAWLLVHSQLVSDIGRRYFNTERHVLGHCPWSQAQYMFPTDLEPWLTDGFQVAVGSDCGACNDTNNVQQELRLMSQGHSYSTHGGDLWQRFRIGAAPAPALRAQRDAVRKPLLPHLQPDKLLNSVWSVPGRLHPALNTGVIETGSRASIAIWDPEHPSLWPCLDPLQSLVMSDTAPALWGLMVNGRWQGERGHVQSSLLESDDYRESLTEARARLNSLLERAGISM